MKKSEVKTTREPYRQPPARRGVSGKLASALVSEVRTLILEAREHVAQAVNAGLTLLYWEVGSRVRGEVLSGKRAGYGDELVATLAKQLVPEFGRGFSEKNVRRMVQFAEVYPDREIVVSLIRQLSWTHFIALIPLKDDLQRDFYAEMCRVERWSVRMLREKINGMLYERTALSKKPEQLIRKELDTLRETDRPTPDLVFRDPYVLDFLGLHDTFSERDLEAAILGEIERFLLELGSGFAFVDRQRRITVGDDDYAMDLLFYHRGLRRLVLIELKLGKFQPADAGQVQLYLKWLDRHERQEGEESPLAIILCAEKNRETVEFLDLGRDGIHVAEYLTALPPKAELARKLHQAIEQARQRLEIASKPQAEARRKKT